MEINDPFIALTAACRACGISAGTIRARICRGEPTPFRVLKHPTTGGLVVLESEVRAYREKLLTQHRVDRPAKGGAK